jgi:hypothetical protein
MISARLDGHVSICYRGDDIYTRERKPT